MRLNLNWVKSYGLKCSLRHRASSTSSQKIVKKYTGPPPHEQFFFPLGDQREKNFLWGTKWKKNPLGDQRKLKLPFLSPQRNFFSLGPPKEVFFPLVPQRKKNCSWGGGPVYFFSFFLAIFSTREKITQILEFCKDQGGKI